ncbi:hypothetical protein TNCV_1568871 [Trichonephila clavipes]|nr:hypothetical protein TNCV_1568871 [Trichonephila clavipes]
MYARKNDFLFVFHSLLCVESPVSMMQKTSTSEKVSGTVAFTDESRFADSTSLHLEGIRASGGVQDFRKQFLRGTIPIFSNFVATVGHSRCDWASVEDLGSVCIEHIILSCLGESSCP